MIRKATKDELDENPKDLKVGDKIILVKSIGSGIPQYNGSILEILTVCNGYYICNNRPENYAKFNGNMSIYFGANYTKDIFKLADRKEQVKFLEKFIEELDKKRSKAAEEIKMLKKFESDEEETAYKLNEIVKASYNKEPVKAIAELLKEMKKSDYI